MNNLFSKISLLLLSSFPVAVLAHHGAAAHFDMTTDIQIEGILTDFQMVNPHGFVYFDGLNEEGELEAWRCEMGTNLQRRASQETLLPGGRVLVTGKPARREDNLCKLELIEHEDGRTIAFNGGSEENATEYQPSEALVGITGERDSPDTESQTIAVSVSKAAQRKIVDVPTEGFFGHWVGARGGFLGVAGFGRNATATDIKTDLASPTTFVQPKYTEAGMALLESFDERFDFPALQCESSVFDGVFHHGNINEFVQESDSTVRWVSGYMDLVRTIHMDRTEHPEDGEASLMGHSYGYWEGDSLIVETANFSRQWLYQIGGGAGRERLLDGHVISSEQLTLRERITHDEANDHLVVEYWAEDPEYWQDSLSGTYHLSRSDDPYREYKCIELGGYNNLRDNGKTIFDD